MQPVVDGLREEYGETVTSMYLNALDGAQGQAAFEFYNLRGHPTVLVLNADGEVVFNGLGIVPADEIRAALDAAG